MLPRLALSPHISAVYPLSSPPLVCPLPLTWLLRPDIKSISQSLLNATSLLKTILKLLSSSRALNHNEDLLDIQ